MEQKLVRLIDPACKIWGGVCAGIAYRFEVSVLMVRILTFLAWIRFPFVVFILYIVLYYRLEAVEISQEDYKEKTAFRWPWSTE